MTSSKKRKRRLAGLEWEAVAGVIAAVTALVLHLLHIADEAVLLSVILVILALLMIRDLRREGREERTADLLQHADRQLDRLGRSISLPDTILIKPPHLRAESERFAERARGEMLWFNVCLLMFRPQALFDKLLRPAIENPEVGSILFVLDERDRQRWAEDVMPKIAACRGAEKVAEPYWSSIRESISFIIAQTDDGEEESHLSFWGEPFMAHSTQSVPRYIFHVQPGSELLGRLRELEREYRLASPDAPT